MELGLNCASAKTNTLLAMHTLYIFQLCKLFVHTQFIAMTGHRGGKKDSNWTTQHIWMVRMTSKEIWSAWKILSPFSEIWLQHSSRIGYMNAKKNLLKVFAFHWMGARRKRILSVPSVPVKYEKRNCVDRIFYLHEWFEVKLCFRRQAR